MGVVAISMGTVITSDHSVMGWNARRGGASVTGRELCRAAWEGVFDAFGSDSSVLIVAALGSQPDALDGLAVPPNAVCVPSFAQFELLKAGVDVFVPGGVRGDGSAVL